MFTETTTISELDKGLKNLFSKNRKPWLYIEKPKSKVTFKPLEQLYHVCFDYQVISPDISLYKPLQINTIVELSSQNKEFSKTVYEIIRKINDDLAVKATIQNSTIKPKLNNLTGTLYYRENGKIHYTEKQYDDLEEIHQIVDEIPHKWTYIADFIIKKRQASLIERDWYEFKRQPIYLWIGYHITEYFYARNTRNKTLHLYGDGSIINGIKTIEYLETSIQDAFNHYRQLKIKGMKH